MKTMLNRSELPIFEETKAFPDDFPMICMNYIQQYKTAAQIHYHTCLELGRVVHGSGVMFVGGHLCSFAPNSVSVLPPKCIHDSHIIMSVEDEASEWQFIFVDIAKLGIRYDTVDGFLTTDKRIRRLFELIFSAFERMHKEWQEECKCLLRALTIELRFLKADAAPVRASIYQETMMFVQHKIATEYASDLTVDHLAQYCNMSVSTFRKHFTAVVGVGPQQYIIDVRLSIAEHLLKNTYESVLNISQKVGFKTLSSFNRLFKKAYGYPPSAVRKTAADTSRRTVL